MESWVVLTANTSDAATWTNITTVRRTGFETTVDLEGAQLQGFMRGKAVGSDGEALGWTLASDGSKLYDAPDDVEESAAVSSSIMTSSKSSLVSSSTEVATPSSLVLSTAEAATSSSAAPSTTEGIASSSSSGVAFAARTTYGVMEQVFVAVVVVGGLALA